MSIDLKFVELTADVLDFFFIKYYLAKKNKLAHIHAGGQTKSMIIKRTTSQRNYFLLARFPSGVLMSVL